jgi:hypothetical protein
MFKQYIDSAVVITKKGLVNVGCLRRLFGLSDAQLSAFTVAACDALRSGARVGTSGALAPFRAALRRLLRPDGRDEALGVGAPGGGGGGSAPAMAITRRRVIPEIEIRSVMSVVSLCLSPWDRRAHQQLGDKLC